MDVIGGSLAFRIAGRFFKMQPVFIYLFIILEFRFRKVANGLNIRFRWHFVCRANLTEEQVRWYGRPQTEQDLTWGHEPCPRASRTIGYLISPRCIIAFNEHNSNCWGGPVFQNGDQQKCHGASYSATLFAGNERPFGMSSKCGTKSRSPRALSVLWKCTPVAI